MASPKDDLLSINRVTSQRRSKANSGGKFNNSYFFNDSDSKF